MTMSTKALRTDRKASSAVEFAVIAPVLAFVTLGIIDGWSLASTTLNMRTAVQTASKYVIEGGFNESEVRYVAMSAWRHAPRDGTATVQRECFCEGVSAECVGLCEATLKPPVTYINIEVSGTWTAPYDVDFIALSRTLKQSESIRVR